MYYKVSPISNISECDIKRVCECVSNAQNAYLLKINETKRVQSVAARALLIKMLHEHFPKVSVSDLEFLENGRPHFVDSSLYVSLTHSDSFVGCALSYRPIGIDVEKIRPVSDKLVSRVCTQEEQEFVYENGIEGFFTLWTLKEAYIKAKGCGFSQITRTSFVKDDRILCDEGKIRFGEINGYAWAVFESN